MKTSAILSVRNHGHVLAIVCGLGLMFFSRSAYAQDPAPQIGQDTLKEVKVTARVMTIVEEVGPMKVRLNVLNPTEQPVRISILNYQNQPVFEESFRTKEYNKVLNFNSTIPGRYSLHVNSKKSSETRRFEIDSKEKRDLAASALERSDKTDVMATIYKVSPTKVMLQVVNNTGKPVQYVFRNMAREELHRGSVKDEKFAKVFDMSEVTDGKYTVEVNYLTDKAATRTFDLNTVYERSFNWTDKKGRPIKAEAADQ